MVTCWLSESKKRIDEALPIEYFEYSKLVEDKVMLPQFFLHPQTFTLFVAPIKDRLIRMLKFTDLNEELLARKTSEDIQKLLLQQPFPETIKEKILEALDVLSLDNDQILNSINCLLNLNLVKFFFFVPACEAYQI